MADSFTIKHNDTSPPLGATLKDDVGTPINLTGADVVLEMKLTDQIGNDATPYKVQATADILDAANGVVEYVWVGGDTNSPNRYRAEFVITFASGKVRSVPNPGFITVTVVGDV